MTEFWAPIPSYEGIYSVSTEGKFARHVGAGLRPIAVTFSPSNGYGYVGLSKDGRHQNFRAHRLVLWAHVGLPSGTEEARHLDGDKTHNQLSNLVWGSRLENAADRTRHGTARGAHPGSKHHNSKLTESAVEAVFNQRAQGMLQKDIAKFWGVTQSNISRVLSQETWNSENANRRAEMKL